MVIVNYFLQEVELITHLQKLSSPSLRQSLPSSWQLSLCMQTCSFASIFFCPFLNLSPLRSLSLPNDQYTQSTCNITYHCIHDYSICNKQMQKISLFIIKLSPLLRIKFVTLKAVDIFILTHMFIYFISLNQNVSWFLCVTI